MAKIRAISERLKRGENLNPAAAPKFEHRQLPNNVLDRRKEKKREPKPNAQLLHLKKQMALKKIDDEKCKQNASTDDDFNKKYREMAEQRKREKEEKRGGGEKKVSIYL